VFDGLADIVIAHDGVIEVQLEEVNAGAFTDINIEGIVVEVVFDVEGGDGEGMDIAGLQGNSGSGVIGDDADDEVVAVGSVVEFFVSFELDELAGLVFNKLEGAVAEGMLTLFAGIELSGRDIGEVVFGDQPIEGVEVAEEIGVGFFMGDFDGVIVDLFPLGGELVKMDPTEGDVFVAVVVLTEDDIVGGEGFAVMPGHVLAEMEGPFDLFGIGFPALANAGGITGLGAVVFDDEGHVDDLGGHHEGDVVSAGEHIDGLGVAAGIHHQGSAVLFGVGVGCGGGSAFGSGGGCCGCFFLGASGKHCHDHEGCKQNCEKFAVKHFHFSFRKS